MKTTKFISILFVVGIAILSACHDTEDDGGPVTDPSKAILGKWELVAIRPDQGKDEPYKPTGYVEYLSDSLFRWYDYATQMHIITGAIFIQQTR